MTRQGSSKNSRGVRLIRAAIAGVCGALLLAAPAGAQVLPGPADASRIAPLETPALPARPAQPSLSTPAPEAIPAPPAAKSVHLRLHRIKLEGLTAFPESAFSELIAPYLDHDITLDTLWMLAAKISARYQDAGYFLSRAYVPAQEIGDGVATIDIVEGYIAQVEITDPQVAQHAIVQELVERIKAQRPLSAYDLESAMLQLNALPGLAFRAFVEPMAGAKPGVTKLTLRPAAEGGAGLLSFDNSGSRFLGPYQATATYQRSIIPLQLTTISLLTTTQTEELRYAALRHQIPLAADWSLDLSGNYVTSSPGATLRANHIRSDSGELGIGINWQPLRQRQENLILTLELSGKNTNGNLLYDTPLTRDRIRAVRGRISGDFADEWRGYNSGSLTISHGLSIFDGSHAGDEYLSRIEAKPDFTAALLSLTRQQGLGTSWLAVGQFSGQLASDPLYSAEEFGYGGQAFGRAYDPSDITGDNGVAASLELRYQGLDIAPQFSVVPYTFYDIGKVWNLDTGGRDDSGSSAGFGVRLAHDSGFSGNLGLAWPLTRAISTPIYGNGRNPRLLLQASYGF